MTPAVACAMHEPGNACGHPACALEQSRAEQSRRTMVCRNGKRAKEASPPPILLEPGAVESETIRARSAPGWERHSMDAHTRQFKGGNVGLWWDASSLVWTRVSRSEVSIIINLGIAWRTLKEAVASTHPSSRHGRRGPPRASCCPPAHPTQCT